MNTNTELTKDNNRAMKPETRVGLFVFLGILSLFILATRIQTIFYIGKEGYIVSLDLTDASGLEIDSKVKINGVNIGYVKSIYLVQNTAKADLFIFEGNKIPVGSTATITQESLLGGKYINIIGSTSSEHLKDHDSITIYKSLASINQTSQKLYETSQEFKKLISKINDAFGNEEIRHIRQMLENLEKGTREFGQMGEQINKKLPQIITQIDELTQNFNELAKDSRTSLPVVLAKIDDLSQDLRGFIELSKTDFNKTFNSAKGFFDKSTKTVAEIQYILEGLNKSQLEVNTKTQNMLRDDFYKTYFEVAYRPNPSNYYIVQAVSTNKINAKDPLTNEILLPQKHKSSDVLLSAQMGKRYSDLLLRLGIIENTGGLGADYFLAGGKLKGSLDLYDFKAVNDIRGDKAHLNFSLFYSPIKHLYFYGGFDNILNSKASSGFLGAGLEFIDDDFKKLAISSGAVGSLK